MTGKPEIDELIAQGELIMNESQNPLTPEQINARIADILGWEYIDGQWRNSRGSFRDLLDYYHDSNAFNRDCVPMLRRKGAGIIRLVFISHKADAECCITKLCGEILANAVGPDIPASAALAFIEVFKEGK